MDLLPSMVAAYLNYESQRKAHAANARDCEKSRDDLEVQILKTLKWGMPSVVGVAVKRKQKIIATDWAAIHKFIRENDAFDLLHKRLTDTAVKLRWEDGLKIDGIDSITVDALEIIT